jgi:hypothetical protein
MIVSGPAGLGKSFTIEQALTAYDPEGTRTCIAKGFARPTGLYMLLYKYRFPGNVIVFDDMDSVFSDDVALNLLKAACDTTKTRTLNWRAETKMVDEDGEPIPREFDFEGTVVFITNIDFDGEVARGNRGSEHFEAMISRSHYIDCDMYSKRDYIVRIRQVVRAGMLRTQKGLDSWGENVVMSFIEENADGLRELTLRMALKLADVYKMSLEGHGNFNDLAEISCMKRRYKKV